MAKYTRAQSARRDELKPKFAKLVRNHLADRRLSQKELAKAVGMNEGAFSRLLNGSAIPLNSTLDRFEKAMGVDLSVFRDVNGPDEHFPVEVFSTFRVEASAQKGYKHVVFEDDVPDSLVEDFYEFHKKLRDHQQTS